MTAAQRTVIFSVAEGEEAIIRVGTTHHITLEFPNSIITLFEEGGVLYTRHQVQSLDVEAIVNGEDGYAEGDEETQKMEKEFEPEPEGGTQVFDDDVGETQIDSDYYPDSPPLKSPDLVHFYAGGGFDTVNRKHLSRLEMEDIAALQVDLFGDQDNN